MYIPSFFRVEQNDEIVSFMQKNPFAILINQQVDKPVATHVPLETTIENEQLTLTGHLAYGNPQWRAFEAKPLVLVIFQGPHSYVSSSWYNHVNVPTWNYTAVHAYGNIRIISGDELRESLQVMLAHYEGNRPEGCLWDTYPREFMDQQVKGIVGFQIQVSELQAAYKLSQNRQDADYQSIVQHLDTTGDAIDRKTSDMMRKQRPQLFGEKGATEDRH